MKRIRSESAADSESPCSRSAAAFNYALRRHA